MGEKREGVFQGPEDKVGWKGETSQGGQWVPCSLVHVLFFVFLTLLCRCVVLFGLAVPRGLPISQTRDRTHALCSGISES